MAFLLYEKQNGYLTPTGEHYSLAGYNLIYSLWEKKGRPTDLGWHISADDLVRERTGGKGTIETHSLLIDFHPSATTRIGIIELLDIYAYTYSKETEATSSWTLMMLRLRNVLYDEYEKEISKEDKEKILKKLKEPTDVEEIVEFLYLKGDDKSWNWGRNGMTNAAFIHKPARAYFRQFF